MLTGFVVIAGVSLLSVGGVLLERHLIGRDEVGAAELLGETLSATAKFGKYPVAAAFFWYLLKIFGGGL